MKSDHYLPPQNKQTLIISWIRRAREAQFGHYELANIYSGRDKRLGVPVIVINAVIGTSAFASISAEFIGTYEKITIGLISLVAAILASLQTFFNYNEQSDKHRIAGARYGVVRRKMEHIYTDNLSSRSEDELHAVRKDLDRLAEDSPNVPVAVFNRVKNNIYETDGSDKALEAGTGQSGPLR